MSEPAMKHEGEEGVWMDLIAKVHLAAPHKLFSTEPMPTALSMFFPHPSTKNPAIEEHNRQQARIKRILFSGESGWHEEWWERLLDPYSEIDEEVSRGDVELSDDDTFEVSVMVFGMPSVMLDKFTLLTTKVFRTFPLEIKEISLRISLTGVNDDFGDDEVQPWTMGNEAIEFFSFLNFLDGGDHDCDCCTPEHHGAAPGLPGAIE